MKKNDYLKILLSGITGIAGADMLSADADIEARLDALSKAPPPTTLMPGAMCYEPVMREIEKTPAEYICPLCGEKTLFQRDT